VLHVVTLTALLVLFTLLAYALVALLALNSLHPACLAPWKLETLLASEL